MMQVLPRQQRAENRFFDTFWLMNSDVDHSVTDNLVQAHISGNDNYPASVYRAYAMASVMEETSGGKMTCCML